MGDEKHKKLIIMSVNSEKLKVFEEFLPLNNDVIEKFIKAWDNLDIYSKHEKALEQLFEKFPENNNESIVLIKCTLLNEFYSAGVRSIDLPVLAKHIVKCNIDQRLKEGDWGVVAEITECEGLNKYISFASKYCNWHNKSAYPIYDKYVVSVLCALKDNGDLKSFKTKQDISNKNNIKKLYISFGNALIELVNKFNLSIVKENNIIIFKLLDRALWLLGKYCFGDENSVIDIAEALGEIVIKAVYEKYMVLKAKNGTIDVKEDGMSKQNTKEALRQISNQIGFTYNSKWNTRQFGPKLIEHINSLKQK